MNPPRTVSVQDVVDRAPISSLQRKALVVSTLFALVDGFDSLIVGFLVPAIAKDWGVSTPSLTFVVVSGTVGTIAGAMLIAPIADRVGRRPVILAGATVFAVFTLLGSTASSVESLSVLRFFAGIGLGAVPSTLIAYVSEYTPLRLRATLVTVIGSGLAAGGFFGGFVAAFLIPRAGWQSVLIAGGVLPLLPVLLGLRWMPETPQLSVIRGRTEVAARRLAQIDSSFSATDLPPRASDDKSTRGVPVTSLLTEGRAPMTVLVWVLYLAQFLTSFFIFSWLPSVLASAGVASTAALMATSICTLGGMVGGVTLGFWIDRFSSRFKVLATTYAIGACAVAAVAMALGTSTVAMFAALFVVGFGAIGSGVCVNAVTASLYPAEIRSTGLGWAQGFGRIGSVLGPALGGLLLGAHLGARAIFQLSTIPVAVCVAAIIGIGMTRRGGGDPEHAGSQKTAHPVPAAEV
ncbi:MFS transporter [Streptomyces sp. NPDC058001]|uniref:MFS transporter n=1 Tax=Streptomyces sp. NPDC058001 TaxID=3346300 RepID=UPI0036E507C7